MPAYGLLRGLQRVESRRSPDRDRVKVRRQARLHAPDLLIMEGRVGRASVNEKL